MVTPVAGSERWNPSALFRLVGPLIVEQLLAVSLGMADTVMVATVSEAAVSGISLVETINVLLINIFTALATGGAVVVSQYIGKRQPDKASQASKQLIYSITSISVVITILALILRKPILQLVYGQIDPDVMHHAQAYFLITAMSYPFMALYNSGAAIFRSMGNSKVGMLISVLVNCINIGGNALLIFGMGWGAAGAATSTLVSRIVAAIVVLGLLMRRHAGPVSLKGLFPVKKQPEMAKDIYKIGIPNGLENSTFQVGKLLVARIVSGYGTYAIAGNALASNLATFVNVGGMAIGMALITVVGQCIGANNYTAAKKHTKQLMIVSHIFMTVVCVFMLLISKPILSLFSLSAEALAITQQLILLFCCFSGLLWPPSFALPNALRAAGDAKFTMVVSMLSMWIFRIGASYILAKGMGFGVLGVWMAMVLDWLVRAIAFTLRWKSNRWQKNTVIQ